MARWEVIRRQLLRMQQKMRRKSEHLFGQRLIGLIQKNAINLLPTLTNSKGKIHTGFNLNEHKKNMQKLQATKLFASEFINNYNQLILTLDQQLKKGSYGQWSVGDLPEFNFANDVDPWTLCQDVPYDAPNPYDFVEIEIISLNNVRGELNWKWGKLEPDTDPSWKKFKYRFKVIKENNQWKISYLKGFDLKEGTAKAG